MPRTCLCHAHLQTARYDVRRAEKEEEGVERREMKKNGVGGSRTFDLPPETGVLLESNWELGTPSRHLRLASPTRQAQKKVVVTEMRMARKGEKGKKKGKNEYTPGALKQQTKRSVWRWCRYLQSEGFGLQWHSGSGFCGMSASAHYRVSNRHLCHRLVHHRPISHHLSVSSLTSPPSL